MVTNMETIPEKMRVWLIIVFEELPATIVDLMLANEALFRHKFLFLSFVL
jgi:hypothetical protein